MANPVKRSLALVLLVLLGLPGCGDDVAAVGPVGEQPFGDCGQVATVANEAGIHISPGQPISWSSNPPATGRHYPAWAAWRKSYAQLARGYWLHNAEHGGIILLHDCGADCGDSLPRLAELVRQFPRDPRCSAAIGSRLLIAADPALPEGVQFAAVAWGAHYTASCFDAPALEAFAREHYARAPEDLCGEGLALGGAAIE